MFLLDPTEGLSREELLKNIWDVQLTPPLRAKALKIAQARGCTWQAVFRDLFKQYDIMIEDPIQLEEWQRIHEEMERRRGDPYDPIRSFRGKDGEHDHRRFD